MLDTDDHSQTIMNNHSAPPPYTDTKPQPTDPPLAYTFPTSFSIGSQRTQVPLVTPEKLKGHLGLLRAFYTLRLHVEQGMDERLPPFVKRMEVERRWFWFVGLAVER